MNRFKKNHREGFPVAALKIIIAVENYSPVQYGCALFQKQKLPEILLISQKAGRTMAGFAGTSCRTPISGELPLAPAVKSAQSRPERDRSTFCETI